MLDANFHFRLRLTNVCFKENLKEVFKLLKQIPLHLKSDPDLPKELVLFASIKVL